MASSSSPSHFKAADTLLHKFRSLECDNCRQHFGYESRKAVERVEWIFCSASCAGERLNSNASPVEAEPTPLQRQIALPLPKVFKVISPADFQEYRNVRIGSAHPKAHVPFVVTPPQHNSTNKSFGFDCHGFRSIETIAPDSNGPVPSSTGQTPAGLTAYVTSTTTTPNEPSLMEAAKSCKISGGAGGTIPTRVVVADSVDFKDGLDEFGLRKAKKPTRTLPLRPPLGEKVENAIAIAKVEAEPRKKDAAVTAVPSDSITIYPSKRLTKLSPDLKWGPSLPIGVSMTVKRVHSNSADDIYVQTSQQSETTSAISQELHDLMLAKKLHHNKLYNVGTVCVAPFFGDYYRAEIVRNNPGEDTAQVFFSDYGNDEPVRKTDLLVLPAHLQELPRQVYQCHWDLAMTTEMTDPEKKEIYFKEFLEIKPLKELKPGQYVIGIGAYVSAAKIIMSENYAPSLPVSSKTTAAASASAQSQVKTNASAMTSIPAQQKRKMMFTDLTLSPHINTNKELNIVFAWNMTRYVIGSAKDKSSREDMHKKLNSETWTLDKYRGIPVVGEIVISTYYGELYRAMVKVVKSEIKKVKLEFIDYGDNEEKKFEELFHPPEEVLKYPRFATNVSLDTSKIKNLVKTTTPEIEEATYKTMMVEFTTMNRKRPEEFNAVFWMEPQKTFNSLFEAEV